MAQRPGLAGIGGRANGFEVRRPPGRGRGPGLDRPHAGDCLEAAGPAATAQRAVIVDDRVPDLAGAGAVALEQGATEDQAGTDAAPDPDRDQVRHAIPARERVFGDGRRLRVVRDVDRDAVAVSHDRAERKIAPVEVDRPADRAGPAVDETGCPDADPEERGGDAIEQLVQEEEDQLHGVIAVPAGDRQLHGAADLAAEIDEGTGEMLFAEVEPDDEPGVLVDFEEDRGLAAAGRAAADLADDAFVEQPGDDVRDGGPGEARLAGDVGAADRPEVIDACGRRAARCGRGSADGSPSTGAP